jgi:hypothetical protein
LDVYKFFFHEAYGIEEPTDEDNPTLRRAHTLDFYKKAISAHVTARNILYLGMREHKWEIQHECNLVPYYKKIA